MAFGFSQLGAVRSSNSCGVKMDHGMLKSSEINKPHFLNSSRLLHAHLLPCDTFFFERFEAVIVNSSTSLELGCDMFKTRPHCQLSKCIKFSGQTRIHCIHGPFYELPIWKQASLFWTKVVAAPWKWRQCVPPDRQIHGCSACQLELVALMLREGKTSMTMKQFDIDLCRDTIFHRIYYIQSLWARLQESSNENLSWPQKTLADLGLWDVASAERSTPRHMPKKFDFLFLFLGAGIINWFLRLPVSQIVFSSGQVDQKSLPPRMQKLFRNCACWICSQVMTWVAKQNPRTSTERLWDQERIGLFRCTLGWGWLAFHSQNASIFDRTRPISRRFENIIKGSHQSI